MSTDQVPRTYLSDYQPPPFAVPEVALKFRLHKSKTQVESKLTVRKNDGVSEKEDFYLNGINLDLISLRMDGEELSDDVVVIDKKGIRIIHPPNAFELSVCNTIDPSSNSALSGMYMSGNILCTQCEAEGFRNITYFPDRPDILSRYSVHIEAHRKRFPVLLSNGELTDEGSIADGMHFARWHDPYPKPSYLFALVAGDLAVLEDEFITRSKRPVRLGFYVAEKHLDKCRHAMDCLKKAMRWDERVYGREYDLNRYMIVAVDHFNMGAMENKGLNIFNSKYVYAKPETATDLDYQYIESIIAHEYFHNWSGNRVTLRDWFQISLKEGFTIFRDQQFSADMGSAAVQRVQDARLVRLHQFRDDAGPKRHAVQPDSYLTIDNFYNITVYNKGAELIRMLYLLLGQERFRRATDLYFERYDGCAVTAEELIQSMEEASGRDLQQFRRWYRVPGTPTVRVERCYRETDRSFQLTLEQIPPASIDDESGQIMHIPIQCALLADGGRQICRLRGAKESAWTDEFLLELREPKQTFEFDDVRQPPVLSLLRGFSAPILIEDPLADEELHAVLSYDDDPFCRWDAWQRISKACLLKLVENFQHGPKPSQIDEAFLTLYGQLLDEAVKDPQFGVLLLEPPSETAIAQDMNIIDPVAIHQARNRLVQTLASHHFERLINLYQSLNPPAELSPEAIGQRSLRNLCLSLLIELNTDGVYQLATDQFDHSTNMTDLAAALKALVASDSPYRKTALDSFYENWKEDSGVVDKWFHIQATAVRDDTLQNVVRLSSHQAFSYYTPNRVYSLIGAFGLTNPYCFHAADGSGYELLKDNILNIDRYNPQGAALLVDAFTEIQRYDDHRQQAMYDRLEELASASLSVNVREVVEQILKSKER